MKTSTCSDKNGCCKPAKLLKTDLLSITMSQKEIWKLEITSYYKKEAKKKKSDKADQVLLTAPIKQIKTTKARANNY